MSTLRFLVLSFAMVLPFTLSDALARDFRLEEYFLGRTKAEGRFSAINGLRRSFTVDLRGSWDGRTLTLVEDFTFADGERDRKTWRFTKTGPDTYRGTREDVIDETEVRIVGDTARFTYEVWLDGAARTNRVRFHDRMVLKPDGTVVNTAWVTKYGLPVARTRVDFRRP